MSSKVIYIIGMVFNVIVLAFFVFALSIPCGWFEGLSDAFANIFDANCSKFDFWRIGFLFGFIASICGILLSICGLSQNSKNYGRND